MIIRLLTIIAFLFTISTTIAQDNGTNQKPDHVIVENGDGNDSIPPNIPRKTEGIIVTNSPEVIEFPTMSDEYRSALMDFAVATKMGQNIFTLTTKLIDSQKDNYPNLDEQDWENFEKEALNRSFSDYFTEMGPIYVKYLSLEEIKGLTDFYKTPLGQKFAEASYGIAEDTMEKSYEWLENLNAEFIKMLDEYDDSENNQ